jgi:murein DD-endopeptidase MepM/ murein hydrolase activator NlpD
MKKWGRERHFSLMFVPDQDQNPRSVSMSYVKGRVILGIMVVLSVHVVLGTIGYFRLFRLQKTMNTLRDENEGLRIDNKRIEKIIAEFHEVRSLDEKMRKAFSGTLGLDGQSTMDMGEYAPNLPKTESSATQSREGTSTPTVGRIQTGLYYLTTKKDEDYFSPDHLPTLLPVEGIVTTHFQKGGYFSARSHYGIDIATTQGSTIRAAGAGTILLADWTPDYGNVVVISHGGGFVSYYAHAMRLLVEQGNRVRKGQPIALLGSSGISSAPHLHFEIWKKGEPLNPETFIYALPK